MVADRHEHGVQGHRRHLRPSPRRRGRDRHGDRARPDRQRSSRRTPSSRRPLQRRLAVLGRRMAAAAIVVCAVVFGAGVARGETAEDMFLTSVSLAVAAIPEGLPAIVTVALALGARRMAERHAIDPPPAGGRDARLGHRHLLRQDRHPHREPDDGRAGVDARPGPTRSPGAGTRPRACSTGDGDPADDPYLTRLARVAGACNDAVLHAPDGPAPSGRVTGDPTEGALAAFAAKLGVERSATSTASCPRCAEIAFDADRRRMTTVAPGRRRGGGSPSRARSVPSPRCSTRDDDDLAADAGAGRRCVRRRGLPSPRPRRTTRRRARRARRRRSSGACGCSALVAIADPPRAEVADADRRPAVPRASRR